MAILFARLNRIIDKYVSCNIRTYLGIFYNIFRRFEKETISRRFDPIVIFFFPASMFEIRVNIRVYFIAQLYIPSLRIFLVTIK